MDRPSRDRALLQTAYIWAARSTCARLHVGCVIEREGRILVQGYNGAPAGLTHCNHDCTCEELHGPVTPVAVDHWPECAVVSPCTRSVHAEQNAISFAARWGVGLERASAWITHQPCQSCAQSLINAGIQKVIFVESYRLRDGLELLLEAGIEVGQAVDPRLPEW